MFDSIRLLCINGAHDRCLNAMIVESKKYLKISNSEFYCPSCGHFAKSLKPFFQHMVVLNKLANSLKNHGLRFKSYNFVVTDNHIDDDIFAPDEIWNYENTWDWNYQISEIEFENPATREHIRTSESIFINRGARIKPRWKLYTSTFDTLLRKNQIFIGQHELTPSQLEAVKSVVSAVRSYNKLFLKLADDLVSAVPLDEEYFPRTEYQDEVTFYS